MILWNVIFSNLQAESVHFPCTTPRKNVTFRYCQKSSIYNVGSKIKNISDHLYISCNLCYFSFYISCRYLLFDWYWNEQDTCQVYSIFYKIGHTLLCFLNLPRQDVLVLTRLALVDSFEIEEIPKNFCQMHKF